jgi:2-polyprenyl-6-hydroxyphenyl methylase/3-demethylubiquinone-9 3-methyltransferase
VTSFDHSSREEFFDYYAKASQSRATLERFDAIRAAVMRLLGRGGPRSGPLDVADVGCGAGTQCAIWAEAGHRAHGLDVNEPLLNLARERAEAAGHSIDFRLGSATALPWADESMDVCLVLELLEHVSEWEGCVLEATRVLRPGGVLVLTTTNKLCPRQQEFILPLYSWYPATLKRRFERLAATTHPRLANFATYPAVNWFSFYSLRRALAPSGFVCYDRFDVMDLSRRGRVARAAVTAIQALPILRWLGHVATPGTTLLAVRERPGRADDRERE